MKCGRLTLVLTLLVAVTSLPVAEAQQAPGGHGSDPQTPASSDGFAAAMHAAMAKMGRDMEAVPMTGDPDRDFLAMMIPHHEGAVEMARLVLIHGQDPVARKLAEEIIAAQQAEITTMTNRLQTLRAGRDPNPGGFPALGGTRGTAPPGSR